MRNQKIIEDIQQQNLEIYVNPLIKSSYCSGTTFDDIELDTTRIVYILVMHELHHVLIQAPFKKKENNEIICEVDIFISISDNNINKSQIIDFFAESKGKINYKIEEMNGSTIGEYNYYDFEIKYDILMNKDKEQRLCYSCDDTDELYNMIAVIDENDYYTISLDFDESA